MIVIASTLGGDIMDDAEKKRLWHEYAKEREAFEDDYNIFSGITTDFQEQLRILMKKKNKTAEKVAEKVGISPKTLSQYRNGRYAPSMQTLMSICMVLELDIKQSTALLTSLGFCFLGTSKEHYAYLYLLDKYRKASLEKCNEVLTGLGVDYRHQLHPRKTKKAE